MRSRFLYWHLLEEAAFWVMAAGITFGSILYSLPERDERAEKIEPRAEQKVERTSPESALYSISFETSFLNQDSRN